MSSAWQWLHRSDCGKGLSSRVPSTLSWNPRKTMNQNSANPSPKGHTGTCSTVPQCEHGSALSQDRKTVIVSSLKLASVSMYGLTSERNSRTYVALVGRLVGCLVGSFGRWCLVGWSHFSLSRPICNRHGKVTCHVLFSCRRLN